MWVWPNRKRYILNWGKLLKMLLNGILVKDINPFMGKVIKRPNILRKSCGVHTARFLKNVWPFYNIIHEIVKGGLSGRMTWQFINVLELYSSYKRKLSNFRFRSIFIFNKKEAQSCQFGSYWWKAQFEVLTSQTGQMAFTVFKFIIR